jgi:hypothetical protein
MRSVVLASPSTDLLDAGSADDRASGAPARGHVPPAPTLPGGHVEKSLSLAARLNETRVGGGIRGQRRLTIKAGDQTTTLAFTRFVTAGE